MADSVGAEIVVEQDAPFSTPKRPGGEAHEQGPRHRATIGRHCHRNAKEHPADDAKRTDRSPKEQQQQRWKGNAGEGAGSPGRVTQGDQEAAGSAEGTDGDDQGP
ncbi:hypothetical protein FOVSG1_006594 [Fusarium oxysporum f. sp. vasinfectum]